MMREAGNDARFTTPILKVSNLIVAFVLVDNTNLIAFNMNGG